MFPPHRPVQVRDHLPTNALLLLFLPSPHASFITLSSSFVFPGTPYPRLHPDFLSDLASPPTPPVKPRGLPALALCPPAHTSVCSSPLTCSRAVASLVFCKPLAHKPCPLGTRKLFCAQLTTRHSTAPGATLYAELPLLGAAPRLPPPLQCLQFRVSCFPAAGALRLRASVVMSGRRPGN